MAFEDQLYTSFEVARMLKLHVVTVRNHVRAGRIRANKVGRNYLFTAEAVNEFFKNCATKAA